MLNAPLLVKHASSVRDHPQRVVVATHKITFVQDDRMETCVHSARNSVNSFDRQEVIAGPSIGTPLYPLRYCASFFTAVVHCCSQWNVSWAGVRTGRWRPAFTSAVRSV